MCVHAHLVWYSSLIIVIMIQKRKQTRKKLGDWIRDQRSTETSETREIA